ncbi:transposase [Streptomyces sp. NPDC055709]
MARDADTRLPIDLWAGRDAEQLVAWLQAHPGVEVVCRDGSLVYRQGITDGAPDAVQVSDRFHLWQGLSKRVGDVAAAHRGRRPCAVPELEPARAHRARRHRRPGRASRMTRRGAPITDGRLASFGGDRRPRVLGCALAER